MYENLSTKYDSRSRTLEAVADKDCTRTRHTPTWFHTVRPLADMVLVGEMFDMHCSVMADIVVASGLLRVTRGCGLDTVSELVGIP